MSNEVTIKLEIGENLKESINELVKASDKENQRDSFTHSAGKEVCRAFGINFTKAVKEVLKRGKVKVDVKL